MNEFKVSDVREIIIQESIKLCLFNGYQGTSVKKITEAAGIARGTLYWYFKSKDEILISIFKKWEKSLFRGSSRRSTTGRATSSQSTRLFTNTPQIS